jgi:hypothetical protein
MAVGSWELASWLLCGLALNSPSLPPGQIPVPLAENREAPAGTSQRDGPYLNFVGDEVTRLISISGGRCSVRDSSRRLLPFIAPPFPSPLRRARQPLISEGGVRRAELPAKVGRVTPCAPVFADGHHCNPRPACRGLPALPDVIKIVGDEVTRLISISGGRCSVRDSSRRHLPFAKTCIWGVHPIYRWKPSDDNNWD